MFTYGGSAGDAFTLNEAIAAVNKNASLDGYEMVLRTYLSVGAISRSVGGKSGEAAKNAFVSASKLRVENMFKSFAKRLEAQLLYGQMGLGVISSVATNALTMTAANWAPGLWTGAENMMVEVRDSSNALRGTATVASVNMTTRVINLDAAPTGTTGTDILWYKGAYGNEFAGLHKIISNDGSLFGISAATYSLWTGNTIEVGTDATSGSAVLTFAKVEAAVSKSMEKGLDEDTILLVNPGSWSNLMTEQAAKRAYDSSYGGGSKFEQGANNLKFHCQVGLVEVVSSIFIKEGFAYLFPKKDFIRIGSRDISFDMPGFEGQFIKPMENTNAYEIRAYSDQALFTSFPGKCALLKFIKN